MWKDIYDFDDNRDQPTTKATGTHWITYLLQSMSGLVDKFGLYLQHFENVIEQMSKPMIQHWRENDKWCQMQVFYYEALLILDLLDLAKKFSLMSQQKPLEVFGIIKMADQFDNTSWPNRLWNEDLNDTLIPSLICHIWIKLFLGSKPRQTRKGLKHSFIKISKLIISNVKKVSSKILKVTLILS